MTRQLAMEGREHGIRANSISPGIIETNQTREQLKDPEWAGYMLGKTLLGRLGRPEEVANVALFLACEESSYVTGIDKDAHIEDPLLTYEYPQAGARMYLGGTDSRDPLASPLFGDLSKLPPLLIQVGSDERLLDDARQYAERAAGAGSRVRLELWEGMYHVFQINVADLRSSGVALDHAAAFIVDAFSKR
jgi:acetyl esterase/lipase